MQTHARHTARIALLFTLCVALAATPLAATAGAAFTDSTAETAGDATLSLTEKATGSGTVTVQLTATGDDVAGYQANLTFDPSVVQVTSVEGADYARPVQNVNNDDGWVFITQSQAQGSDDPVLATITFEAVGSGGQSALQFVEQDTKVNDVDGNHVSVSVEEQRVSVEGSDGMQANGDGADSQANDDGDSDPAKTGSDDSDAAGEGDSDGESGVGAESVPQTALIAGGAIVLVAGIVLGRQSS
ncbi:cohesin domain-containing protein [Haloarchaeobius sp. DFWS5]|uniref:cohesin domain-containing protein n=1 Tax=Haloarchaeobius sp. DFWS5 TaxID=3446114 RepID=UPI003EBBB49F